MLDGKNGFQMIQLLQKRYKNILIIIIIYLRLYIIDIYYEKQIQLKKEAEDKIKNEEFENANKEFCTNFISDLEEREKKMKIKENNAEVLRLKGNNLYKKKLYSDALVQYMEALKIRPYDNKILLNIAQVI